MAVPASHLLIVCGPPGAGKSTAARVLAEEHVGWQVIEVDEIKVARYGTAERCDDPIGVFSEAGAKAGEALNAGSNVIAVEFFNRVDLLNVFLHAAGRRLESDTVSVAWLTCTPTVAVERKRGQLSRLIVEAAHAAGSNSPYKGADVIETDGVAVDAVKARIASGLLARGVSLNIKC